MAKAIAREERTEVVVVDEGGVTLELTMNEAQILMGIMGKFAGHRDTVPYDIYEALDDQEVHETNGFVLAKRGTSSSKVTGILVWETGDSTPW